MPHLDSVQVHEEVGAGTARLWAGRSLQLLPSLVVLLVGVRYISIVPLWTDELWVWAAAKAGLGESHGEPFQLPLYTTIWALTGGGRCLTEACLRWPGLVSAAVTVWIVGLITARIAGRRAGLAASTILMGVALVHRSTLEAHHYALTAMFITLTLLLVQMANERPESRWPWPLYALALVAAGVLQPVALAASAGHAVLIVARRDRQVRRKWFITLAACSPLALIAGWLYLHSGGYGGAETHGQLVPNLENVSQALTWPVSGGVLVLPAAGAIAAILLMLALETSTGRRWLLAGAMPMLLVYAVSLGPRDFWFGRFLWPFIGFFIVAAAIAFRDAGRWRYLGIIGLILLLCYPLMIVSLAPWSRGTDFRTAMTIVDANWKPGDAFRVSNVNDQWGLEKYGTRSSYETVATSTSPTQSVWSFGLIPPCFSPESWSLGPQESLWRCPPSAPSP
jgi:mannosyltransferase